MADVRGFLSGQCRGMVKDGRGEVSSRWMEGAAVRIVERMGRSSGTVTFLLTDVEGSTRGWETAPEAMAVAIARHSELLHDAITAHSGVRPVEQDEGDSVVGTFSWPSD